MEKRSSEGLNMNLEGSRGLIWKIARVLVNWFRILEQNEGSKCKIVGPGADL